MSVPGIGAKGADKILELREAKGDLELHDLNQVPYLRITQPLLDCLDSRRVRRTDGGGYCPGADVFLTPPGVCLSMKVLSISL
jgi:hypothetical protein